MSSGKNEGKKPSFKSAVSKFGQGFVGIFRAIPRWLYVAIIPLLIGVGGTILCFEIIKGSDQRDLPQTQVVNDPTRLCTYAYDGRTKGPSWVMQALTTGDTHESVSNIKFYEDSTVPPIIRSKLSDYQNSGFDIANLLNVAGTGVLSERFPLSTASPQLPRFNKIYWIKIDNYVRELIRKLDMLRVLVITGPLYLPHEETDGKKYVTYQVIGENNIAVPTHFFKAIFYAVANSNGTDFSVSSEIYVIPNKNLDESVPLESFKTSLENLEKISGIVLPQDIKPYLRALVPPPRM